MKATTKTAQFTPGPWRISECQLGKKLLIQHGDENTLSPIVGSVYHDDGKLPQHANANLIAAAPAMYEALAKLRLEAIHYRNTGVGKQFLNEAIAQAEQAINQVWGEGNHDTKREG